MPKKPKSEHREVATFGIGEWFGHPFHKLTPDDRTSLLAHAHDRKPTLTCPARLSCQAFDPKAISGKTTCSKKGGVCGIREYIDHKGSVSPRGAIRTTCPYRFLENGTIFKWIGEVILGTPLPLVVREIEFLEVQGEIEEEAREIGYIDNVLVHPESRPMHWCALEIQAVYFSGGSMGKEFAALKNTDELLPFPAANRHPDYRSSGPKRLMPQLQIKVPSLRRWGKKMAVVVDADFFASLATMDDVSDISNCDIAWFVVQYKGTKAGFVLNRGFHRFTTLERSVEGLTGGHPVSLGRFEERLARRVQRFYPERAATLGLGQ
ncbi:MAG: hypothetical protein HY235_04250 [Acidobacteria bacterium]|nr:hypothetical protein [Acidobacteriota bacterium]